MSGWQPHIGKDEEFIPYKLRDMELSMKDGCVLWGHRVIIPAAGRAIVMCMLHEAHPGITRIKWLARSFVWWPGMDSDLEGKVKNCQAMARHPLFRLCIPGSGQPGHGLGFMWIFQVFLGGNVHGNCGCSFKVFGCSCCNYTLLSTGH